MLWATFHEHLAAEREGGGDDAAAELGEQLVVRMRVPRAGAM